MTGNQVQHFKIDHERSAGVGNQEYFFIPLQCPKFFSLVKDFFFGTPLDLPAVFLTSPRTYSMSQEP